MKLEKIKKVYADYHGMRYTRETDGKLGQWKLSGTAEGSKVKDRTVNWNADLIDETGRHQTSALAYPMVGMQSLNDIDYVEYQILLAKTAHIDGFMVEWGFPEHTSNTELQKILQVAEKYDFEVGINWCDAWHFYNWIEEFYPSIKDRKDKVEYFKKSLQYLIDHVYGVQSGVLIDGHPILFLFGGGPTAEEFQEIKNHNYKLSENMKKPLFFGRAPIEGEEVEGVVQYHFNFNEWFCGRNNENKRLLDGVFGWIPTRVRRGEGTSFINWDRYATKEDAVKYLETLTQSFNDQEQPFALRISSSCPEMDNRGCASWGKHDLSHIPREDGKTYEKMWDFNVKNKEEIDIVFLVSWNDFTEMHQIEPTIEDGDRELRTTEKYAAQFKGIQSDPTGIELPLRLFNSRKKSAFLKGSDINTEKIDRMLDEAGMKMSQKEYKKALDLILIAEQDLGQKEKGLTKELLEIQVPSENRVTISSSVIGNQPLDQKWDMSQGIFISFSEELAKNLRESNYLGWLYFDYLDEGDNHFIVQTHTKREKKHDGDYSIVCDIKKDNTSTWKKAKVQVFKENAAFGRGLENNADFSFVGAGFIRNIKFKFEIFK